MSKRKRYSYLNNSDGAVDDYPNYDNYLSGAERSYGDKRVSTVGTPTIKASVAGFSGTGNYWKGDTSMSWTSCAHTPKAVTCGDTKIYASGRRHLAIPDSLREFDFAIPLGAEFNLASFIGYTGFLLPFPIKDFTAPDANILRMFAERMLAFARKGNKVITFCEGGHGRTGLVLATCIGLAEPDVEDPIVAIRKRHCDKACETNDQIRAVFEALRRPLPDKYKTGGGSKAGFIAFTDKQLDGLTGALGVERATVTPKATNAVPGVGVVTIRAEGQQMALPALPAPPPPPKPLVVSSSTVDEPLCKCPRDSVAFSVLCPIQAHADKAQKARGVEATDPFAFAGEWPSQQWLRLLTPLPSYGLIKEHKTVTGKWPSWVHPQLGLRCAVCLGFEVDPTRLTVSHIADLAAIVHHLDCDEINTYVPILTDQRISYLQKDQPALWQKYVEKRRHRRKRLRRKANRSNQVS